MNRWAAAVAAVGTASGVVALIQAFSFTPLPRLEGHYDYGEGASIFEFISSAHANTGTVVMLDVRMRARSPAGAPFERKTRGSAVSWHFDSCTMAAEVTRQCAFTLEEYQSFATDYARVTEGLLEERLSSGEVSYAQLAPHLGDNGTNITITGALIGEGGQSANPYSSLELETEGVDIAEGPYQISMSNRDGNRRIWMSPAPFTAELASQVRCARRHWPAPMKFLLCPFL